MSRFNHHRKLTTNDYVYRFLTLIGVLAILVLCIPKDHYVVYHYSLGEPWDDSPIIAKDSFPVFKSEEALKKEKDSLQRYYEPYFHQNPEVAAQSLAALRNEFKTSLKGVVPEYYLKHLANKLDDIYSAGIMKTEDHDKLMEDNIRSIKLFNQNSSTARSFKNIYTEKTAYEAMMAEEDSVRYSHAKLQRCDLNRFIATNLTYDIEKSLQQRQEIDNMLVPYMGQVLVGQKIVDQGQIVDEYTYNVLRSMERFQEGRTRSNAEKFTLLGGQVIFVLTMLVLLFCYFEQFRSDYIDHLNYVCLVLLLYLIFPISTYTLVTHKLMNVLVIPYCVMPIFVRVFMDSRTAFVTHLLMILTCSIALRHPFEFVLVQTVAGLVAIYSLRQLQQRSDLFRAVVALMFTTLLTYLCLDMLRGNFFNNTGIDRWAYIYLFISAILSLIAYLLLIPIERIFGFTSNVTLVELSNINSGIMRRMSEEAPGTFQHSLQVANLAAEVANKIGAKSQLVRTGALYHDIGKLERPEYFTENQGGSRPHEGLSYEKSAEIIIQHVQAGLKLADKYKLPSVIKDFITTHHGRSMTKFFYISCQNQYPDRVIDKKPFTYAGPNPQTQEQAILMMADSVEAASRSLPNYTEDAISTLVEKIVDSQVQEGYFNECPITFLDIQVAKEVFKTKLKTIYHTRIQYPEIKGK